MNYNTDIQHVTMEDKILDSILNHVKKKNRTQIDSIRGQCPRQLKNIASLVLVETQSKQDYFLKTQQSQLSSTSESVRLSYTSLFKGNHSARKLSKRILIMGEPGTGKSVLCTLIAEGWADGKLFQEFFLVLFLPLNQRNVTSAKNLPELLQNYYEFDSEACYTVQMYMTHNRKDKILIIADGWQELCESDSREGSFLHHLLFDDLLPSSSITVVVTSTTESAPHQFRGRSVILQGFHDEIVKSYVEMELSSDPDKLCHITKQLETNPLVGSICNVPFNIAMICNFCQSCNDPLPDTMPELYERFAWNLAYLKLNSTMKYGKIAKLSNYRDLPDVLQQSWLHLCELAFQKCQSESSQAEIASTLFLEIETFGLFKYLFSEGGEVTFSFLHPAFRYFLAASYLLALPQSVQSEIIKCMRCVSPIFCRFYLSMNRNLTCDLVSDVIQKLSKLQHLCIEMCLISYESKNEIVDREIVKSLQALRSSIMLHSQNAYECIAMIHMLEKMDQQCTVEINFRKCNMKAIHISRLATSLDKQPNLIRVKGLDLSDNCLGDTITVDFFSRSESALGSLEKLFLRGCDIGAEGLEAVIDALAKSSCKSLTQLDLSYNSLPVSCLEYFQQHIAADNLGNLEILMLKGSLPKQNCMSFLKHFAATLSTKCKCLRQLDLSDNMFGSSDDPDLRAIVSRLTTNLGASFDLRLDDTYRTEVENNFLAIMEESIRNKGMIDHTIGHGVFVGPGRSGKSILMQRLMGEGPPDPHKVSPSTGVLDNVVKVEVKKLSAVAHDKTALVWQKLKYDEEAIELIMTTTKNYTSSSELPRPMPVKYVYQRESKSAQDKKFMIASNRNRKLKDIKLKPDKSSNPKSIIDDDTESNEKQSKHVTIYSPDIAPVDLLKKAVKLQRMDALRKHLESSWSLYLTNTGGQIEFQECLPLLVCGPSIFFVTFPLHRDLNQPYEVRYQYPDGSMKNYLSPFTLIQEIQQILATIYTLNYVTVQVLDEEVTLKPTVFFIGTHKDCLSSDLEIMQIDQHLQRCVKQTHLYHQGSIQFASDFDSSNECRLLFMVNNLSNEDHDFQKIRFAVQQTVELKCSKEFTVQCPSSWLIFSLILREKHKSNQVLELEDCFKIAQECGISTHEELTIALSFIHSRLGLVRYFDVQGLNSLVVVDPQIIFDKITELIVETFVGEYGMQEKFHMKGIISVAVIKRISERSGKAISDKLPFIWLIDLLNYLRLAAYFKDSYGEKYFFPSALGHVSIAQHLSVQSPIHSISSAVLIAFESGFCPRGLAGALIKCLMTNEMKSSRTWELICYKIFRNQVSFHIEACCDVTLKVLPTHIEISLDIKEDINDPEYDPEYKLTCKEVYTQINKCMEIVTKMYKKCEYYWTFYCTQLECHSQPHPAAIKWDSNTSFKLICKIGKTFSIPPKGYKMWNIRKKIKSGI